MTLIDRFVTYLLGEGVYLSHWAGTVVGFGCYQPSDNGELN